MLGHASAAMTLDVHADLFDDPLEAVAKAMSAARKSAVSEKCGQNVGRRESSPRLAARGEQLAGGFRLSESGRLTSAF